MTEITYPRWRMFGATEPPRTPDRLHYMLNEDESFGFVEQRFNPGLRTSMGIPWEFFIQVNIAPYTRDVRVEDLQAGMTLIEWMYHEHKGQPIEWAYHEHTREQP